MVYWFKIIKYCITIKAMELFIPNIIEFDTIILGMNNSIANIIEFDTKDSMNPNFI